MTLILPILSIAPIHATTYRVPSEYATIQEAINACTSGDTVLIAPGTYTGNGNRDLDPGGRNIVIRSELGADQTIIDCQGSEAEPHRGFYIHSGEDSSLHIEGLTITGGFAAFLNQGVMGYSGGGIAVYMSGLTLMGCNIVENFSGYDGGGLTANQCSHLFIYSSLISNNVSDRMAGGIYVKQTERATIEESDISLNLSENGGAIVGDRCSLFLRNSIFRKNRGTMAAGTLRVYDSTLDIEACTFYGNQEFFAGQGAVVWSPQSKVRISRSIIVGSAFGPAITCFDDSLPDISCSNFYGNIGGDWNGCVDGLLGVNGNFSADPLFCDSTDNKLELSESSPCLPQNSPCAELIGARGVGCIVTDVESDSTIPQSFSLHGYPNPFNPAVSIEFKVRHSGHLKLSVFDLQGRLVTTLADQNANPGLFRTEWNGLDKFGETTATGVYFVKLENEKEVRTLQLVRIQ